VVVVAVVLVAVVVVTVVVVVETNCSNSAGQTPYSPLTNKTQTREAAFMHGPSPKSHASLGQCSATGAFSVPVVGVEVAAVTASGTVPLTHSIKLSPHSFDVAL